MVMKRLTQAKQNVLTKNTVLRHAEYLTTTLLKDVTLV